MATASSDLHALIHAMSPAERAYFKRFGYRSGSDRREAYLKLFDAIGKQEQYNEAALRRQFITKGLFSNLASAKNHLYQHVLRALTEAGSNGSGDARMGELLKEISALRERNLDVQCARRLDMAWNLLEREDMLPYAPLLCETQLSTIPYTETTYPARFALLEKEAEHLRCLMNLNAYRVLYARMTEIVTRRGVIVREPDHIREVEALLSDPLLTSEDAPLSFPARNLQQSVNKILRQVICRYDEALIYARKNVELIEAHPEKNGRHQRLYFMALFNLLNDLVGGHHHAEFQRTCEQLDQHINALPDTDFKRECRSNLLCRIAYQAMATRNFPVALDAAVELKPGLSHFDFQPHLSIQHRYLIACALFYNGKHSEALDGLEELLRHPYLEHFRDFHNYALVLHLMLHFELDNRDALAEARDRVYRVLNKRDMLYGLERILLGFLRRYERIPSSPSTLKSALVELRDQLLPLQDDPFERHAFGYFDFVLWLDARIERKSMLQAAEDWKRMQELR